MNLSVISKKVGQYPVLFVCGAIIPLLFLLLFMRGPKVKQYNERLPALEKDWHNIQTNIERSVNLDKDIEALESGLAEINSRLMDVDQVASNYEFFYGLENQAGVVFKQFSKGNASDGKELPNSPNGLRNFSVIPFNMSIDGTLRQILNFLDLLERQERIVHLDQLNIVRSTDNPEDEQMLNVRLTCHVLAAKNE